MLGIYGCLECTDFAHSLAPGVRGNLSPATYPLRPGVRRRCRHARRAETRVGPLRLW
jgi:hypothetical protein